jgi:hypothetical protein
MRTVLFTLVIALFAGACGLYFDTHGSNSGVQPDASPSDDAQHGPLPDAADIDAGHAGNDGGTNCGADAGGFPDAAPNDAGWLPDASEPVDAAPW